MIEFEIIQELESNTEILEIIKNYEYTVKNGKLKHLKATNLQFIEPTEYLITYPTFLTITSKINKKQKLKGIKKLWSWIQHSKIKLLYIFS